MIISCNNIREIENINLHDAYIENVIYNHSNKVINVELESEWEKTDYDLSFHEVLYYEMTCCDFWGCGYNVICWSKFDGFIRIYWNRYIAQLRRPSKNNMQISDNQLKIVFIQ